MNIQCPIERIGIHFLNTEIQEQSEKWDSEAHFTNFQQALDTLDIISDGLPDDPKVANALNALHSRFSEIFENSKVRLLPDNN